MTKDEKRKVYEDCGFTSYREYLKSSLWASIRKRVFKYKGKNCSRCKFSKATCIHHGNYKLETMKGDDISQLHPMCKPCHDIVEKKKQRSKRVSKWHQDMARDVRDCY